MELKSIIVVIIKLSGIYLIVNTTIELLAFLPTYISNWSDIDPVFYVSPILSVLIGALFWLIPNRVAGTIVQPFNDKYEESGWLVEAERIGIVLLGLYLLFNAVVSLFGILLRLTHDSSVLGIDLNLSEKIYIALYVNVFQFVLALVIIVGARNIVRLIRRASGVASNWPTPNK